MSEEKEVYAGQTIKLTHTFYDFNGNVVDPSTHEIVIYDPDGNQLHSSTSPIKEGNSYYIPYNIPEDAEEGDYKAVWKAELGSLKWVERIFFSVVRP